MKKNTGFIKKVRQGLGSEVKAQLIKEASALNLDKYVEELTQAIPDGLAKCTAPKDCIAAAEVCTLLRSDLERHECSSDLRSPPPRPQILTELHSRFSPEAFAYPLTAALSSALSPPDRPTLQALPVDQKDREETARVNRQKVLARISAELAMVELLRTPPLPKSSEAGKSPYAGQDWLYGILKDLVGNLCAFPLGLGAQAEPICPLNPPALYRPRA